MTNEPTTGADANGAAEERADAVLATVRQDFEEAERKIAGEIDPGVRALVIAVLVLLLLGTLALPHTGKATGWDVLSGDATALAESISITSRVFVWGVLIFGVVCSMLALVTRRWAIAWGAVAGTAITCILGMLAIWSRLTPNRNTATAGPAVGSAGAPAGGEPTHATTGQAVHAVDVSGPGIGLILGVILVVLLTFYWIRVVWARSSAQLVAAEERRSHADEQEQRVLEQMRRSSERRRGLSAQRPDANGSSADGPDSPRRDEVAGGSS